MKKSSKTKVKVLVFALALLLCLALSIGAAGAWYQANRTATGTLNMDTGIKIEYTGFHQEVADSDTIWQKDDVEFNLFSTTSVVPGTEIVLEPNTTINAATGSVDFYARFKLDYKFYTDLEGTAEATGINPTDVLVPSDSFINSAWVESSDGFYYLASGTTLTELTPGGTPAAFFADGAKYTINTNIGGEGFGYQVDADTKIVRADVILTLEVAQVGTPWEITEIETYEPVIEDLSTNVLQDTSGNAVTGDVVAGTTYQIVDAEQNGIKYQFAVESASTLSTSALTSGVSNLSSVVVNPNDVDGTATVTGYAGSPTDVVIPDYIVVNEKTYKVTEIGASAFKRCSANSITIPHSVMNIAANAFNRCSATNIVILDGVTNIADQAFYYCYSTNIQIPNTVVSIGYQAFWSCNNLQPSITEGGVKYLGNSTNPYVVAWKAEDTSITSCLINNQTKIIASCAFDYCNSLENIRIPGSVVSIGASAFYELSSLTTVILETGLKNIGDSAFNRCSKLANISIPNSVISIGKSAFYGCAGLVDSISLEGVVSIGDSAFDGCSSLKNVTLGDKLKNIGYMVFDGCSSLESLTIKAIQPPTFGYYPIPRDVKTIYVPKDSVDAYKESMTWATLNIQPIA